MLINCCDSKLFSSSGFFFPSPDSFLNGDWSFNYGNSCLSLSSAKHDALMDASKIKFVYLNGIFREIKRNRLRIYENFNWRWIQLNYKNWFEQIVVDEVLTIRHSLFSSNCSANATSSGGSLKINHWDTIPINKFRIILNGINETSIRNNEAVNSINKSPSQCQR